MKKLLLLPLILLISTCSQPVADQPVLDTVGEINVIPKPQLIERMGGQFELSRETVIVAADDAAVRAARAFNEMLTDNYGMTLNIGDPANAKDVIVFSTMPEESESERYILRIEPHSIRIAGGERGMFYGAQSLFQLLPVAVADTMTVPAAQITDSPRFRYRGAHLDVSRHFMPVEFVKKYIRLMSRYKLNYFHWHLTDDQGWRIEIKKYPRLTEVGSKRPETVVAKNYRPYVGDGRKVEGFYTQDEIRDVVAYARARYVTVVPEIDMPAHASAALAAYPEYGCKSNYRYRVQTKWTEPPNGFPDVLCPTPRTIGFLIDVLGEVMELFPDSPYVHIGGDETNLGHWTDSAEVKSIKAQLGLATDRQVLGWFIGEIGKFVGSRGKKLICWDDVVEPGRKTDAVIMFWDTRQKDPRMASADHEVIMTPYNSAYFDHPQGPNEPMSTGDEVSLREVYMFDPVPPGVPSKNIIGGQGCVWTEFIKTPERVEYMAFPRMLALAEVLWSRLDPPDPGRKGSPNPAAPVRVSGLQKNRDFDDFTRRLSTEFFRLDRENVNYRVPEPYGLIGRMSAGGRPMINLSSPVQGGKIYYTIDGKIPTESSELYQAPQPVNADAGKTIEVKAMVVTQDGRKGSVGRYEFFQR
jgi:hexosaminidase